MVFLDRADAGRRLAQALAGYRGESPIVLALPRGGVPVAAEIAQALDAPLDLLLVRKIGVPQQPEVAAGAVAGDTEPIVVRNEEVIRAARMSEADFDRVKAGEIAEIQRRRRLYLGNRAHPDLVGRTLIVVDDGIATGATMEAALLALRQRRPRQLVMAVPVAPPDVLARLEQLADKSVCLEVHDLFGSVGQYYDDFRQLSDEEVKAALAKARSA